MTIHVDGVGVETLLVMADWLRPSITQEETPAGMVKLWEMVQRMLVTAEEQVEQRIQDFIDQLAADSVSMAETSDLVALLVVADNLRKAKS